MKWRYYCTSHVCRMIKKSYQTVLKWAEKNNVETMSNGYYVWTIQDVSKAILYFAEKN